MTIILLVVGFIMLVIGANHFVDGSASLAKNFKVSSLIIGLTIVAAGTSAPELAVSLSAAAENSSEIAVSNVIGSNIFNLLAILGVCAVMSPLIVEKTVIKRDFVATTLATLLLFIGLAGFTIVGKYPATGPESAEYIAEIPSFGGIMLMAAYIIYLAYVFTKEQGKEENFGECRSIPTPKCAALIILGLIMIIVGGKLVVHSAKTLAALAGMSETLIGLTIVAIGTSLPELVTSVIATKKGQLGIALGNVLGSNMFNLLFILGVSAMISPISINVVSVYDLLILLIVTIITWLFAFTERKLNKPEGVIMLGMYAMAMTYAIIR